MERFGNDGVNLFYKGDSFVFSLVSFILKALKISIHL